MRERAVQNMGVPVVVLIAAAVIVVYSLWGATLLAAEQKAFAQSQPTLTVNR